VEELTRRALSTPVQSAPPERAHFPIRHRCQFSLSDQTRSSPKKAILETLLQELERREFQEKTSL